MYRERDASIIGDSLAGQQREFNDCTDDETQRHENSSIVVLYRHLERFDQSSPLVSRKKSPTLIDVKLATDHHDIETDSMNYPG